MHSSKTAALILSLVLLLPILSFAQNAKKSKLVIDTVRVQGRVGLAITINQLPGQKFVLEIPEIFTLQNVKSGLFNYSNQQWTYDRKGARLLFEDDQYKYAIVLKIASSKKSVGLDWNTSFTNKTDSVLHDLAAFNCWTMNTAILFKDLKMERTFVYDSSGKKILLKDVSKNQAVNKRTMQFYPSVEGIDLSKSPWINQWDVNSSQHLSGNKVSIISTDSAWVFENTVNGKVAYFFNNWEHDHGCLHASPLLARNLKPKDIANASGSFIFKRLISN